MSGAAPSGSPARRPAEWDRLELAVRRLLDAHQQRHDRVRTAERRLRELEAALRDLSRDGVDPITLAERVEALEAENRDLHARLDQARSAVERILARLQFLEEAR